MAARAEAVFIRSVRNWIREHIRGKLIDVRRELRGVRGSVVFDLGAELEEVLGTLCVRAKFTLLAGSRPSKSSSTHAVGDVGHADQLAIAAEA
jgi:hypothetical protein